MEHAGLRELVGRELSSVEFVRDYVQLRFDGPCFFAYTMPVVQTLDRVVPRSAGGYVEALIDRIGKRVDAAERGVARGRSASTVVYRRCVPCHLASKGGLPDGRSGNAYD